MQVVKVMLVLLAASSVLGGYNYNNTLDRAFATALQHLAYSGGLVKLYAEFINITEEAAATIISYSCPNTTYAARTSGSDLDLFLTKGELNILVEPTYFPYGGVDPETGEVSGILVSMFRYFARAISAHYHTHLELNFIPMPYNAYTFVGGVATGMWYSTTNDVIDASPFDNLVTISCPWDNTPVSVAWKTSEFPSYDALVASNATVAYSLIDFPDDSTVESLGFQALAFPNTPAAFNAVENGQAQGILEVWSNLVVLPAFAESSDLYSLQNFTNFPLSGYLLKIKTDDIIPPAPPAS